MEVRRCPRCKEPSAVCVREWQHSVNMLPAAPGNRDFLCQSCGAAFVIRPRGAALGLFIVAGIFAPVALLGFVGAALDIAEHPTLETAVKWTFGNLFIVSVPLIPFLVGRHFRGNSTPVVPGAPIPDIRYRGEPGEERARRCRCGGAATCTKVTSHRVNGIPTGTERDFSCTACGRKFAVDSTWGTIVVTLGVALCFLIGGALLYQAAPDAQQPRVAWVSLVFGIVFVLAGVLVGRQSIKNVHARIKCPQIADG